MIVYPGTVEATAKVYLKETLEQLPRVYERIINTEGWKKWTVLCAERATQLDREGYIQSKYALKVFIEHAAAAYADRYCEEWERKLAIQGSQKASTVSQIKEKKTGGISG